MLGGYTWAAEVNAQQKVIHVAVYIFISAERVIELPGGVVAVLNVLKMSTDMPCQGKTQWKVTVPQGWTMKLLLPKLAYAENYTVGLS